MEKPESRSSNVFVRSTVPRLTHQVIINLPAVEKLQHAVDKNIDAKLEEYYDERKRKVVFHILHLNAVQRWKPHLQSTGRTNECAVCWRCDAADTLALQHEKGAIFLCIVATTEHINEVLRFGVAAERS